MIIYIVGCGAAKLDRAAPASELYIGPLFREAFKYAEGERTRLFFPEQDVVRILSAKHGLLAPEEIIEPYNLRLCDGGATSVYRLRQQIPQQWKRQRFVMLCGADYSTLFLDAYRQRFGEHATFTAPMSGMGIGRQLKFLRLANSIGEDY